MVNQFYLEETFDTKLFLDPLKFLAVDLLEFEKDVFRCLMIFSSTKSRAHW